MTLDELFISVKDQPVIFVGVGELRVNRGAFEIELFFVSVEITEKTLNKSGFQIASWNFFGKSQARHQHTAWASYKKLADYSLFQVFFNKKKIGRVDNLYKTTHLKQGKENTSHYTNITDPNVLSSLSSIHTGLSRTYYSIIQNGTNVWLIPSSEIFTYCFGCNDSSLIEIALTGIPNPLYNEAKTSYLELRLKKEVPNNCAAFAYRLFQDKDYEKEFRNISSEIMGPNTSKYIKSKIPHSYPIEVQYIHLSTFDNLIVRLITKIVSTGDKFKIPKGVVYRRDNPGTGNITTETKHLDKPGFPHTTTSIEQKNKKNISNTEASDSELAEIIIESKKSAMSDWDISDLLEGIVDLDTTTKRGEKFNEADGVTDIQETEKNTRQAPTNYKPAQQKKYEHKKANLTESETLTDYVAYINKKYKIDTTNCWSFELVEKTKKQTSTRKIILVEIRIKNVFFSLVDGKKSKEDPYSLGFIYNDNFLRFNDITLLKLTEELTTSKGRWQTFFKEKETKILAFEGCAMNHNKTINNRICTHLESILRRKGINLEDVKLVENPNKID
jgi:hypothetical protein